MRAKITASERPVSIFQGEDKTLTVTVNEDLTSATEIEFSIDSYPQISKTLSAGEITSVTATGFTVQIDAADTTSVKPNPYKHQARATIGGKLSNIKFTPNKIRIMDSVFVDGYVQGDYS